MITMSFAQTAIVNGNPNPNHRGRTDRHARAGDGRIGLAHGETGELLLEQTPDALAKLHVDPLDPDRPVLPEEHPKRHARRKI